MLSSGGTNLYQVLLNYLEWTRRYGQENTLIYDLDHLVIMHMYQALLNQIKQTRSHGQDKKLPCFNIDLDL